MFIGYGCIVLPNVTIGSKVIVGTGTVISKDIPDNVVVVQGTDSTYRVLCTFDEYIEKQRKRMEQLPVRFRIPFSWSGKKRNGLNGNGN